MTTQTFHYNNFTFVRDEEHQTHDTHGFFREESNGILLLDLEQEPIAFVCTMERPAFTVTAYATNSRVRYMFSTTAKTEKFLGIEGLGFMKKLDISEAAVQAYRH